jgi:DNA-binding NtrC family response regulator
MPRMSAPPEGRADGAGRAARGFSVIGLIASESAERADLARRLNDGGRQVIVSAAADASIAALISRGVDALIVDLSASGALRLLRRNAAQPDQLPVICLANCHRPNSSAEALRLGAADIVATPVRVEELHASLLNLANLVASVSDEEAEMPPFEDGDHGVVSMSPAMHYALELVPRLAASRCSVLLVGERGSGREMLARAIHAGGPHPGRFVKVACGAAEIADISVGFSDSDGRETTLYLEEVADLRDEPSRFLLARLQHRHGDDRAPTDDVRRVRLIASTQPHVINRLARSAPRSDLVDALAVVRLDVPPLRQRAEDIPPLAVHFLKEACRRERLPVKTFSRGTLQLLTALPWRRNAAELKTLCERLTVAVARGTILLEDVLANVRFDTADAGAPADETLRQARDRFEREYLTAVVDRHHGRIGPAARQLGIERTNLYRKLKQFQITARRCSH